MQDKCQMFVFHLKLRSFLKTKRTKQNDTFLKTLLLLHLRIIIFSTLCETSPFIHNKYFSRHDHQTNNKLWSTEVLFQSNILTCSWRIYSECSQWMLRKYCSSAAAQWEQLDDLGSDPCLVGKHQSCWSVPEQDIQSSLLTPKICQLVISPVKMHKHIMNWDFLQMFHWLVFVLQQSASWCIGI